MMTLTKPALTVPVATEDLVRAIELACSPVLGALNMANALGGVETDPWLLVRTYSLAQLIDEAIARDVDLTEVKAACCDLAVTDTPPFRGAIGYDPRPRCALCNRRHASYRGTDLSCGDNDRFRNAPKDWRWTRSTAEAAVEGTYTP